MADPATTRRLSVNPTSGGADHVDEVRLLAAAHQFPVVETERSGHATDLAMEAAGDGVELLAVCGGDGTINEVVDGLAAAGGLDSVPLCILPAGTENIIAGALGIEELAAGFELAESGEPRRLDLGVVNDEPFVMSAVAGLPADVSDVTTAALKKRFGSVAFVVAGLSEGLTFDGLQVEIGTDVADSGTSWAGEALAVLVGNLRDPERIRQYKTTQLDVTPPVEEPIRSSLDGEIRSFETATFGIDPRKLRVRVDPAYTPHPHCDF